MDINAAVVLAAGEGTRLRPLTRNRPKPMLPAADRPILDHVLDALVDAGIDDIHLVVGYHRDRVQNHVGSTFQNRAVTYHVQDKQLGSGHALLQAQDALDADFVVINGDQIASSEMIASVADAHTRSDTVTMAVRESARASAYGAVELDDDRIVDLVERPRDDSYRLMNAGIYAFGPSFFADLDATERHEGELAITDAIVRYIGDRSAVRGVRTEGLWIDATYPWDLPRVARELLARGLVDPTGHADGRYVSDDATVHESAVLQGPVVVAPDAVIGPNTVIGPHTAVGQNATVNAGTVIRTSVLDTDTRVGANATIADSVLGQRANLADGVVLAADTTDVRVGDRIHTDVRLGAVVADGARLGGGVTVAPGSLIGPDAHICAGAHVAGNINAGVEVRR
jgi:glucose-1-phosphate thymidylyltransferase